MLQIKAHCYLANNGLYYIIVKNCNELGLIESQVVERFFYKKDFDYYINCLKNACDRHGTLLDLVLKFN